MNPSSSREQDAASNALGTLSARPCSETCVIKPIVGRDVTDGVSCDQEIIKAREVEKPAASEEWGLRWTLWEWDAHAARLWNPCVVCMTSAQLRQQDGRTRSVECAYAGYRMQNVKVVEPDKGERHEPACSVTYILHRHTRQEGLRARHTSGGVSLDP